LESFNRCVFVHTAFHNEAEKVSHAFNGTNYPKKLC